MNELYQEARYPAAQRAQEAIAAWFNSNDKCPKLGEWTLDNIVDACLKLPDVANYLDVNEAATWATRRWIVRSCIGGHIKFYIDNKAGE
jgi:hypothetical protein